MSPQKVSRTQSRETALQILFCQSFTDLELSKAVHAVESVRTIEAFKAAIAALDEHRRAAQACIESLEGAMKSVEAAAVQDREKRKAKPVEGDGTLATRLHVDDTRRDAISQIRQTASLMESGALLFDDNGFCRRLLKMYDKHRQQIDSAVDRSLEGWSLRRLIAEDSAVLRLGATEILYFDDIPPKVVMNEYIELAKEYGDDDSAGLVNGVLDRILRDNPREKPAEK